MSEPPEGLALDPRAYANWWVSMLGEEIARTAGALRALLEAPDAPALEIARLRGLLACDRGLFEFWAVRARKLERRLGRGVVPPGALQVVVPQLLCEVQALGPRAVRARTEGFERALDLNLERGRIEST